MPDEPQPQSRDLPDEVTRQYLETRRRALIMELRVIERVLAKPRTMTEAQRERLERQG